MIADVAGAEAMERIRKTMAFGSRSNMATVASVIGLCVEVG